MDGITEELVGYTEGFSYEELTESARRFALQHVVDSVACAIAGYGSEPAQVAIRVARRVGGEELATVFGAGFRSAPAYAAFANTIMVRALDWNDGMLAKGGGHPSDMIAGVLAAAEVAGSSGRSALEAVVLAYELLGGLGNAAPVHQRGFDQGTFMGVAAALAMGRLRGLSREQLGHAVSLAIVPAIPLMVTRRGELSMWKGAATAAAILNASNAVALAQEGMTGPSAPFEGKAGVIELVSGPLDLKLPANLGGKMVIELSHQKQFPAETHSQALLELVPRIRTWTPVEEIESIEIEAYAVLCKAIGSDPSVWDPQTRETADHSLPYLLAVALVDGEVTVESFRTERFLDRGLRPLMAKIRIQENREFTEQYRPKGLEIAGSPRARIRVRRRDGAEMCEEVTYAKGHSRNPMTAADVDAKLAKVCAGVVEEAQREQIKAAWWHLDEAPRVADVISTLADFGLDLSKAAAKVGWS